VDAILKRAASPTPPRSPREILGSAIMARWSRIIARLAERPPGAISVPPPEWFSYPPF